MLVQESRQHDLMESLNLHINGMTCGGCAASLEKKLNAQTAITAAEVNFATESARIQTEGQITARELVDWVKRFGFSVRTETLTFKSDKAFESVPENVRDRLDQDSRVVDWSVNEALGTINVITLPEAARQVLIDDLATFALHPVVSGDSETASSNTPDSQWELWVAIALATPLVAQMFSMWAGLSWHLAPAVEWLLATPIQFWMGRVFYRGAWHALKRGEANMDTLVVLGTSAAYGYSVFQIITRGDAATGLLYFEASSVVITLVLVGKSIEARAKHSAREALQAVLALRPATVRVLRAGQETEIAPESLHPGDVLVIRSGERVGADGTVIKGDAEIDAAAMTGEPIPESKTRGDAVISGTLVVNGTIRVSADRVGAASTVFQVAELVKNAQMGKAPIQQLVDRISRIFVPVVIALATLTLFGWLLAGASFEFSLIAAVSVLVIACPCALGLATPTALVAGTGLAAKHGILIKDIQTLEALTAVDTVAFDKTGTLTQGTPSVVAYEQTAPTDRPFDALAHAIARESEHPLAQAIAQQFKPSEALEFSPETVETIPGQGIQVTEDAHSYRLGQARFAGEADTASTERTRTVLSDNEQVLAWFEFEDTVRPEAVSLIQSLNRLGLETCMLTGDKQPVAARLGSELGIDRIMAELTPDQKIQAIRQLQTDGRRVAMVGDGINDGPALAAADVGIALGSGSEIALKSAPVVLMRQDLTLIQAAHRLAVQTRRVIRQNLGWAFGYNVLCIPLAMSGLLTPAMAGFAMALSSVSVVVNALRLKHQTPV